MAHYRSTAPWAELGEVLEFDCFHAKENGRRLHHVCYCLLPKFVLLQTSLALLNEKVFI